MAMAMNVSSACFCVSSNRRSVNRVRGVASEDFAASKIKEDKVQLGGSDLEVTRLGIGAWSWGDTSYWNNFEWDDKKMKAAKAAFDTSVDCGITFFDTAEVYGSRFSFGAINSETLLGRFIKDRKVKDPEVEVAVATKYAALPWRLGRQSVLAALKESLNRLGLSSVELYQLHWPGIWGNEGYIDGLGDAVEQGLVKAVGVSNYSESRLRAAYEKLKKRGIPLASNQVNYSLIYRAPEENGVKAACDELGVTLIAYSPIAQGGFLVLASCSKSSLGCSICNCRCSWGSARTRKLQVQDLRIVKLHGGHKRLIFLIKFLLSSNVVLLVTKSALADRASQSPT
ncbi:hypothetical protein NC652_004961 [Populus alba x Populus x berolinensis]|nr:hypothetical protein NC652_004961 [Populus alba x Populus x berolinensis]